MRETMLVIGVLLLASTLSTQTPVYIDCVDTNKIIDTTVANLGTCGIPLVGAVTTQGIELQDFCTNIFKGLKCVAKVLVPDYSDTCFKDMTAFIQNNPNDLFENIKTTLTNMDIEITLPHKPEDIRKCNIYKGDGGGDDDSDSKDDDGKADEEWNTACPMIEHEDGLCPQEVCAACKEKEACCNVGGDNCRKCYPDMRQCGDLLSIFSNKNLESPTSCLSQLIAAWRPVADDQAYCGFIWPLVECLAGVIMPGTYKDLCYKRMATLLVKSPREVVLALQKKSNGTIKPGDIAKYIGGTERCSENPLSREPSRPVPDDVKTCSERQDILRAVGQCRLNGNYASINNCENLMDFMECIAKTLVTVRDENTVKKCAGEVYAFVLRNRQSLPQTTFGNIDPEKCQERHLVCGKDLTPLDRVDCSSTRCPGNYECKKGFCCPLVKSGYCPKMEPGDRPVCKKVCRMDHECENDEKCCDGCGRGSKYCMKMDTEDSDSDKSKCEALLEERKKLLLLQGICGDGSGLTKLPSCQNNRFSPAQIMTETGRGYCVTEDGRKINGSDFTGNRDCTKVKEGACPAVPQCQSVADNADICRSDDSNCGDDKKCCTFLEQPGTCVKKCITPVKAQEQKEDDCNDRKCCPMTLCQNKICLADKTARCSIKSCGECKAVFYNLKGEEVDCNAGVPLCLRKRAMAREENSRRRTTDYDRLSNFMKGRDNGKMNENDDDDDDDDDEKDANNMERARDYMKDEYGIERDDGEELPDDENDKMEDDMEKTSEMMGAINRRICALFDNFNLCQNGGTCKIGSGESFWEFCKCTGDYSGAFCENEGAVSPKDTMCNRDKKRAMTISAILMGSEQVKEQVVLTEMFNKLKPPQKMMPNFTCDVNGDYEEVQVGMTLPHTLNTRVLMYCVDKSTGLRIKGTPVTLAQTGKMPDCSVTDALPDIMSLDKRCMVMNMTLCKNKDSCQYFWNQETKSCDKGEAMGGFNRLTDCYDTCSIQRGCTNDPNGDKMNTEGLVCQKGIIAGPKPCRGVEDGMEYDMCNYKEEFCEVMDTESGHIGECKAFPERCLGAPESGDGDRRLVAYYFNTMTRTCQKYHYTGRGGLLNRFYSLQQCHTECSTRMFKYDDDAVCPVPKLLEMSMEMSGETASQCDGDEDCEGTNVCCYNGKGRVCTNPVRTCASGVRCSLLGSCSGDECVCEDCTEEPVSENTQVCGTDGHTYQSVCHMRRKSCQMMQNISVAFTGPCKTKCGETEYCEKYETCSNNACTCPEVCAEIYQPVCARGSKSGAVCSFSNECVMNVAPCKRKERYVKVKDELCSPTDSSGICHLQCTKEYNPVCVYDTTSVNNPKQDTYGNLCLLKEAMLSGKRLRVLSPGACSSKCGTTMCPYYKTCMDSECQCQDVCTMDYRPVCGHPVTNDNILTTFSNICVMKQQACTEDKLYVIAKHGPCQDPEPELQCPDVRDDLPFSGDVQCKKENNEGCDTEMGERCCAYGAGKKCIAKNELVRKTNWKLGICPAISGMNFDESTCNDNNCINDDDCAGKDSKCCDNSVCGFKTCSASIVKTEESPCSQGSQMVSLCDASATETGCGQYGTCTPTTSQPNVAVCCVPYTQLLKPDAGIFCQYLASANITCANGGTCIGNIREGKVCQCKDGYFGPLCRDYVPTNCNIQAMCVANPCEVTKCPGVPDATCVENTCEICSAKFLSGTKDVTHLCHASPCLVQKAVLKELNDFSSKEMATADEEEGKDIMPFTQVLAYLMTLMKMPAGHVMIDDLCTADGHFKPEQCTMDMEGTKHCYCVNTKTGVHFPNGPMVRSSEGLDCSALNGGNNGLQKFCLQQPSMRKCSDPVKRAFFNTRTMACEEFEDYGCDFENGNNFVNIKACKSSCGAMSNILTKCATVKCGFGKECVMVGPNAECQDPDNITAEFEPVCDDEGNFYPKQCNGEICTCVNPTTGEPIANSAATGKHLMCEKDGNTVKVNRTKTEVCNGNKVAVFCKNGGDRCNNCTLPGNRINQRAASDKIDDQGVCKSCKSCPSGQGKQNCKTDKLCVNKCKGFPSAVCQIDKCTCQEEYYASGQQINCSALHTDCEIERHNNYLEEKAHALKNNGKMQENGKQIKCSKSNSYLAQCHGNKCQCLNATDGTPVGEEQTGKTVDTIDCNSVQKKTKPTSVVIKLTITKKKNLSDLSSSRKESLKRKVVSRLLKKYNSMKAEFDVKLIQGSILAEIDISSTCVSDCTDDVSAIGDDVLRDADTGDFIIEDEGEVFVASEGRLVEIRTGETPTTKATPMDDDDDDNTTTIIIVIVVVAVVCLVAIAVACYCYTKTNKSKNKDIQFTDIQGKSNPAYARA